MLGVEEKLSMSLDEVLASRDSAPAAAENNKRNGNGGGGEPVRRGGARPPRREKRRREEPVEEDANDPNKLRYRNEAGMEHMAGTSLQDIANGPAESRVLKVSAGSHPKTVAGSISHVTRACGQPPSVLSLGNKCINQAVKAVAIAAQYLEGDGISLSCTPEFRDGLRNSVALRLFNDVKLRRMGGGEVELTVSSRTESAKLAGAVAAKVREQRRCAILAIGVDSVAKAVYAIAMAREYLSNDDEQSADNVGDVHFIPSFVHTKQRTSGEEVSALKLSICVEMNGKGGGGGASNGNASTSGTRAAGTSAQGGAAMTAMLGAPGYVPSMAMPFHPGAVLVGGAANIAPSTVMMVPAASGAQTVAQAQWTPPAVADQWEAVTASLRGMQHPIQLPTRAEDGGGRSGGGAGAGSRRNNKKR